MTQVNIKRVYDEPSEQDGYRVLVDRLWPRGMKREYLKYDYWAKEVTPSNDLSLKSATIIQYTIKGRFMSR